MAASLVRLYVQWVLVPGYVAVVGGLTILGLLDGTENLAAFLAVSGGLAVALAAGAILFIRGTSDPAGFKAWLSRVAGWLLLAAVAIPFISGLFVLGPLLILALAAWIPLRSKD